MQENIFAPEAEEVGPITSAETKLLTEHPDRESLIRGLAAMLKAYGRPKSEESLILKTSH